MPASLLGSGLVEKTDAPGQTTRDVVNIVQKDAFQGLSALLVADVQGREDRERLALNLHRARPHPQVEGLAGLATEDATLPDLRLPLLAGQDGPDGATRAAELRGPAAVKTFVGMDAAQGLARTKSIDLISPLAWIG